jgi:four helix bundle protein
MWEPDMTRSELETKTKTFAVAVIRFVEQLPKGKTARILGNQLLRSATSIGANYREAGRAESRRDFVHKVALSEKEAAESLYWLELFDEAMIGNAEQRLHLFCECAQLVAIFTRMGKTAKQRISSTSDIRHPTSDTSQ